MSFVQAVEFEHWPEQLQLRARSEVDSCLQESKTMPRVEETPSFLVSLPGWLVMLLRTWLTARAREAAARITDDPSC